VGIWEATPQDHADQSKHPETADPNTDALDYHNEVELHLAGSKLCVRVYCLVQNLL
jgi:hypothetical protein